MPLEALLLEAMQYIANANWLAVRECAEAILAADPEDLDGRQFRDAAERALSNNGHMRQTVGW